jgi:hypothetical protein
LAWPDWALAFGIFCASHRVLGGKTGQLSAFAIGIEGASSVVEDLIDAGLSAIGGDEIGFPENPIFCGLQRVQTNRLTLRSHYLALGVRA